MKKTIILASHYTKTPGMVNKFKQYLEKSHNIVTFLHPLYPGTLPSLVQSKTKKATFFIPKSIQYPLEGIVSLFLFRKSKIKLRKTHLAVSFDPLSFIHLYLFKRAYSLKNIIYFNLDYSVDRFRNPLMNMIYQKINYFAYKRSIAFFCPSPRFVEEVDPEGIYSNKAHVLPHTVEVKSRKTKQKRQKTFIVFSGTLSKTVNFIPLLKALQKLNKENISFHLDIYGDGTKKHEIESSIKELNLDKNISFKGIVSNDVLLNKILPTYDFAVAPYARPGDTGAPDHMFHGTDLTSKLTEYMSCGLPFITTRLYKQFDEIEKHAFGRLANDKDVWYDNLHKLLTNSRYKETLRKNCYTHVLKYDVHNVLLPLIEKYIEP